MMPSRKAKGKAMASKKQYPLTEEQKADLRAFKEAMGFKEWASQEAAQYLVRVALRFGMPRENVQGFFDYIRRGGIAGNASGLAGAMGWKSESIEEAAAADMIAKVLAAEPPA